jgi:PAS domain S-box-containing protein
MQSPINFQELVASVGDGVMAANAQGLITLWNPACERMFGFTEADALGKSLDLIIPQRQQKPHWDGYHKTMTTGITKYGNDVLRVPAVHEDGHTLSIAFTVSMLYTADGKVSAIVAVIRDESVKFAEERQLRKRVMELEAQLATKSNS